MTAERSEWVARGNEVWLPIGDSEIRVAFLETGVRLSLVSRGNDKVPGSFAVSTRATPNDLPTFGRRERTHWALCRDMRFERDGAGCVRVQSGDDVLLELRAGFEAFDSEGQRHLRFHYPEGVRTLGLGEKLGPLDRRGRTVVMWNTDAPFYDAATDPLYKSIPFWISCHKGRAHGVFIDDPGRLVFDLGQSHPATLRVTSDQPTLEIYVLPGPHPAEVLERYTRLTGRPSLPPLWALGYQQCRYSYFPEARVRSLAHEFRDRGIPCDVIYLDIHAMDGYRCFTWDRARFPDPKGLLQDLHDEGFRVVPIIDPGIKVEPGYAPFDEGLAGDHFLKTPEGELALGDVWPGSCAFPDFLDASARAYWGRLHAGVLEQGIDGVWNDMNEPSVRSGPGGTLPASVRHHCGTAHALVHNAYASGMLQATWEALATRHPDRRPFVLTRAGYAGFQRFAFGWSGDNSSTWDDLRRALPMALSMGHSGVPFYGADVGGFGGSPDPELVARWFQLGAVFPLFRSHSCFNTPDQEPWSFGEPSTTHIAEAISLRYRLLPYIYSLCHHAAETGFPPLSSMALNWPERDDLLSCDDQAMLGSGLLVAPSLHEGHTLRAVKLPPGRWFSFEDGTLLPDRPTVTIETPLGRLPLLARGGAIVPWAQPRPHTGIPFEDELTVRVFPQGDGVFTLVEDAGDGPAVGIGPTRRTHWRTRRDASGVFHVDIDEPLGERTLGARRFAVEIPLAEAPGFASVASGAWSWNPTRRRLEWSVAEGDLPSHLQVLVRSPEGERARRALPSGPGEAPLLARGPEGFALQPPDAVTEPWWRPSLQKTHCRFSWNSEGLDLVVEVALPEGWTPCHQAQDDGVHVLVPNTAGRIPRHFLATREDPAGVCYEEDARGLRPTGALRARIARVADTVTYGLKMPRDLFGVGPWSLGRTVILGFYVQESDRTGRRASYEWGGGKRSPDALFGHVVLAS